ncbi:MAG: ATP-binding protein [Planctomycetota bacterium]
MRLHQPLVPSLIALAAIAAVVAWQYADLRDRDARHLDEHRRYGEALWNAVDGIAVREFRGGLYDPAATKATLTESLQRFGLQWIAIEREDREPLAFAGRLPERGDSRHWFEHEFTPLRPLGRALGRNAEHGLTAAPDEGLRLVVVVDAGELTLRQREDLHRMLVTSSALTLGVVIATAAFVARGNRQALREQLAGSAARVQGLETLRRLGAGLVHETKNPLGVVRGLAQRIAEAHLPAAETQRTAAAIVDEADRTVARLDEFLLLSRPARLRRTAVALPPLFSGLRELLQADVERAGARFEVRCADGVVDADHDQLRRLLTNLLLNAAQAVGPGDTVTLFCERADGRLRLGVEDDGPGVPVDLEPTLFEPYVSGRPGGTGLGLAIARRVAIDHGFELRHERRSPRGARFVVEARA